MDISNEIKGYIASAGESMASVAEKLGQTRANVTNKINNESLRYKDAKQIADLLDYDIVWVKRK